ncbi:metal ABC transporter permease [Kerstersia similis]|uniref:metal ABC transporter permease n=1 Tax=Kerstersia similis TaxID=206505 RepID=UPI0039EF7D58
MVVTFYDFLLAPFVDFGFMRRALTGTVLLALAAAPLGVFLILRRMSLMGDAMSHALLPGVAVGFLVAGLSWPAMLAGGLVTGLLVALLSGIVSRLTPLREDASMAAFYLISLSLGVLLVSLKGTSVDLMHVLFGTVLGLDNAALYLVSGSTAMTLLALALFYRIWVAECLDSEFVRTEYGKGGLAHMVFLGLVVLNLVSGFQVLGTLMAVGLMMLPAAAARFWAEFIDGQIALAAVIGVAAGLIGLLWSFHWDIPSSPAIILSAGVIYLFSLLCGPRDGLLRGLFRTETQGDK